VTYLEFLALFMALPLILGVILMRGMGRRLVLTLTGISILALLYTGPWDNLIVINGVWSYGSHRTLQVVIGHVPVEEYAFYVLQVFLAGMLAATLLRRARC
jgi:lycopene beta-cyclase